MTDNNANLKKQEIVIPGQTTRVQEYSYDALNRLQSARELVSGAEQWKQQFTYDRWGNRTINTGVTYGTGINNRAFTVDPINNRLGVPGGQSGVMEYDAAGNLKNDTYTGVGTRTYDTENRITSAWGGNNQAQLYDYDTSGHRVKRTVDGVETWQVYGFGGNLIAEYSASGSATSPKKEYGYRNGELLIAAEAGTTTLAAQNVTWTNGVGVSISGNNLTRIMAGDGWSTGARSAQSIVSGDGYVEYTVGETNKTRSVGLTTATSGIISYQYINYGFYLANDGQLLPHENFATYGSYTYATGDKLRVSIEGGVVKFRKNGTLLRTSSVAPTYPLYAGAAISGNAGTVTGAVITSGPENVGWTSGVGVSISGNNLTRTMAGDGWSTGARSTQSITSGDGYVEYTVSETNKTRSVGLTTLTSGIISYQYINYGFYLGSDGQLLPHENFGTYGSYTYATGDKLRISIEGGVVKFRKNGTLLRTSSVAPTYPLYAGAAISSNAGTVTGAIISLGGETSTSAQFRWLVSDHLGTPRMIFDQTGDLANMKRHDYLPFGEELFAPAGGRSTAMGYAGGDNVRQQFTKYERDIETGLDYANARYYASVQGRFTSPDPLAASGEVTSPQSWNRYSYVLNDPLTAVDPSGLMWVYQIIGQSSGSMRIRITWKNWKQISKKDAKAGYKAIDFGGQQSKDVTLTDGSVFRLHANSDKEQQISGPKPDAPAGGYVNTGLVKELGRQTAPIPAATGAFIGASVLGGYSMTMYGPLVLLNSTAYAVFTVNAVRNPEEQTDDQALIMAGTRAPEFEGGSVSQSGFLDSALKYLGPGYKEVSPGRFVSADGLRQVRFGAHETKSANKLHGHFESYDRAGGKLTENTRVVIRPK